MTVLDWLDRRRLICRNSRGNHRQTAVLTGLKAGTSLSAAQLGFHDSAPGLKT